MTFATRAPADDLRRRVLHEHGLPSAMVSDPAVRRRLASLERLRPRDHRRAMVDHEIADREEELAGDDGGPLLVDLRLDDELLSGLYLIRELLP